MLTILHVRAFMTITLHSGFIEGGSHLLRPSRGLTPAAFAVLAVLVSDLLDLHQSSVKVLHVVPAGSLQAAHNMMRSTVYVGRVAVVT